MPSQPTPAPGSELLRALAAAALRDGDPGELAARAASALRAIFRGRKSFVLDVQFTGFLFMGKPLGGADPSFLRAAGQLIVHRITRVGFTPDAEEDDLHAFFEGLAVPAADLGAEGIAGWLERRRPHGVYVSATTAVYRPPARPKPAAGATDGSASAETAPTAAAAGAVAAASTDSVDTDALDAAPAQASAPPADGATASADADRAASTPSGEGAEARRGGGEGAGDAVFTTGGFMLFDDGDAVDLSDFELVEEVPAAHRSAAAPAPRPAAAAHHGDDPGVHDMYHFFRTASGEPSEEEIASLPALLRDAENPTRFDELAEAAARAATRLIRAQHHDEAMRLLEALASEGQRPDRTRVFRDSAVHAARRIGTAETLHQLGELLQHGGERERIIRFLSFLGGDAVPMMESLLFRVADAELRAALFRALMRVEGMSNRIAARVVTDPSPARTRVILELAALPEVDPDVSIRWLTEASSHADATVRMDVARHAAVIGGRAGLRILLDLLNDRDALVKRAAAQALGTLGDAGAVHFLARLVPDGGGDEEVQLAAINALARIGSGEAVPALAALLNKRALFGPRKVNRAKAAALGALARIPATQARELLHAVAGGKDAELAAEAQRALATAG